MRVGTCGALLVVILSGAGASGAMTGCEKRARQPRQSASPSPQPPAPPPRVLDAGLPDAAPDAAVDAGLAFAPGDPLDRVSIQKVFRAGAPGFRFCFEQALKQQPNLAGRVDVNITIEADGTVGQAEAKGLTPEVEQCMVERARKLRFPPGSAAIKVHFPFIFKVAP